MVILGFSFIRFSSSFSFSFVFCIASIAIFLSLIVFAMSLYLNFLFVYCFPLTLSNAIFYESILFIGVVVMFSLVICLWNSYVTPLVAELLQVVVEMALVIVFWSLEP